jgi:YesN/AraC family two-component response regulator
MPRKEGIEIITAIRKDYPQIKIIAMSGGGRFTPEGYLRSAKILGADRIFTKPFNHREMMTAIDELIGK